MRVNAGTTSFRSAFLAETVTSKADSRHREIVRRTCRNIQLADEAISSPCTGIPETSLPAFSHAQHWDVRLANDPVATVVGSQMTARWKVPDDEEITLGLLCSPIQ